MEIISTVLLITGYFAGLVFVCKYIGNFLTKY